MSTDVARTPRTSPEADERDALRVILVEDNVLFRAGLAELLRAADVVVVDELGDAERLAASVAQLRPDVVIMDVCLPPTLSDEGIRAAIALRAVHPETGVLVLSTYAEGTWAARLFAQGSEGLGYLLKDRVADVETLVDGLTRIANRGTVVDTEVVNLLVGITRRNQVLDQLTDRERAVLELMAEGLSNVGIGKRLYLSPRTVEAHIASIFGKLPLDCKDNTVNKRVLAVLQFLQEQSVRGGPAPDLGFRPNP